MKITKRIILIILSALLVLSTVACGKAEEKPKGEENTPPAGDVEQTPPQGENPPSEDEEPSQEENKFVVQTLPENSEEEMKAAWEESHPYPLSNWRYYGTYNDYIIIFFGGNADVLTRITVGKSTFSNSYAFVLYAYKDGEFNKLEDIYNLGHLNDEEIATMVEYHEAYKLHLQNQFHKYKLPENLEEEIKTEWNINHTSPLNEFRFYGVYKNYYIIFIIENADIETHITIGKSTFSDSCSFDLYAYKDGVLKTVEDLYKSKYLRDKDIEDIVEYHEAYKLNLQEEK